VDLRVPIHNNHLFYFLYVANGSSSANYTITAEFYTHTACKFGISSLCLSLPRRRRLVIALYSSLPSLTLFMYVQIAYFVGVQIEEGCKDQDRHGLSPQMRQLGAVGAVKVAVRSLSIGAGPSMS
jgi:hypothetical protein